LSYYVLINSRTCSPRETILNVIALSNSHFRVVYIQSVYIFKLFSYMDLLASTFVNRLETVDGL